MNALRRDIQPGEVVVISPQAHTWGTGRGRHCFADQSLDQRCFICQSGDGMAQAAGTGEINGQWLACGCEGRINGPWLDAEATAAVQAERGQCPPPPRRRLDDDPAAVLTGLARIVEAGATLVGREDAGANLGLSAAEVALWQDLAVEVARHDVAWLVRHLAELANRWDRCQDDRRRAMKAPQRRKVPSGRRSPASQTGAGD